MRRMLGRKGKGGGHGTMAGGWLPIERPDELEAQQRMLSERLLRILGKDPQRLAPIRLADPVQPGAPRRRIWGQSNARPARLTVAGSGAYSRRGPTERAGSHRPFAIQTMGVPSEDVEPCIAVPGGRRADRGDGRLRFARPVAAAARPRPRRAPTDQEMIQQMMIDVMAALTAKDVEKMVSYYADDFTSDNGDKAATVAFLSGAKDQGFLDGIVVKTDAMTIAVEGETAKVGPVNLEGAFGALGPQLRPRQARRQVVGGLAIDSDVTTLTEPLRLLHSPP